MSSDADSRPQAGYQTAAEIGSENHRPRSAWVVPFVAAGLVGVLAVLLVTAFSWPATQVGPREVPVAVTGTGTAVTALESGLAEVNPRAFDVVAASDEAQARALIAERDVYGAILLGPEGTRRVLVASAASPAVAQLLRSVFAADTAPEGATAGEAPVEVVDVAPLPAEDPQGAGLAGAILPLTLTAIVTAGLGAGAIARPTSRLLAALLTALTVATGVWLVLDLWLSVTGEASPWLVWASLVAGAAALILTASGAFAAAGLRGFAVVAATFVLLGNPWSASSSAPELLPNGWSTLGQLLPQGAVVSLLRSAIGFDGSGATAPRLVLGGWVILGLALFAVGVVRSRRRHTDVVAEGDRTSSAAVSHASQ